MNLLSHLDSPTNKKRVDEVFMASILRARAYFSRQTIVPTRFIRLAVPFLTLRPTRRTRLRPTFLPFLRYLRVYLALTFAPFAHFLAAALNAALHRVLPLMCLPLSCLFIQA